MAGITLPRWRAFCVLARQPPPCCSGCPTPTANTVRQRNPSTPTVTQHMPFYQRWCLMARVVEAARNYLECVNSGLFSITASANNTGETLRHRGDAPRHESPTFHQNPTRLTITHLWSCSICDCGAALQNNSVPRASVAPPFPLLSDSDGGGERHPLAGRRGRIQPIPAYAAAPKRNWETPHGRDMATSMGNTGAVWLGSVRSSRLRNNARIFGV